jgi:outer membrane protein OmpA-like peptidoglycan-associated protein
MTVLSRSSGSTTRRMKWSGFRAAVALAALLTATGCLSGSYTTPRNKTAHGAEIGAAAGAVLGAIVGEGHADSILAGAAIGAGVGAGVGAYMDAQQEKLARIPGTSVERVGKDTLLVHFSSDVLFDVDSAVLAPGARSTLDQTAQVLMDFPKTAVVVEGFTDSTGTETHNLDLSQRRADMVANDLIGRGVDPARVTAIGYGESHPVASNATPEGQRQNRRVEILLKGKA